MSFFQRIKLVCQRRAVSFQILPAILCVLLTALSSGAVIPDDSLRSAISVRLDSLDMVAQELKRRGEPLEEIEKTASILKDSLVQLRGSSTVQSRTTLPDNAGAGSLPSRLFRKGHTLAAPVMQLLNKSSQIDRAIAAIGGIAVISGIILLLSLFIARSRKKRPCARPRTTTQIPGNYTAAGRALPLKSAPAKTDDHKSGDTGIIADRNSPNAGKKSDEPENDIALLRQRVRQEGSSKRSLDPLPRVAAQGLSTQEGVSGEVRGQIIAAAAEGVAVTELSRRFHLSTDHISLILKVAAKEKK